MLMMMMKMVTMMMMIVTRMVATSSDIGSKTFKHGRNMIVDFERSELVAVVVAAAGSSSSSRRRQEQQAAAAAGGGLAEPHSKGTLNSNLQVVLGVVAGAIHSAVLTHAVCL